jgi:hypothetical protein
VEHPLKVMQWCMSMLEYWNGSDNPLKLIQQSLDMLDIGMVRSIRLNGINDVWSIGMEQSIHNDPFKVMQWCLMMLKHWDGSEHPLELKQ